VRAASYTILRATASLSAPFAQLNLRRSGLRVLMFHDVNAPDDTCFDNIYSMRRGTFVSMISALRDFSWEFELPFCHIDSQSNRGLVLTFDDGLQSVADTVFPILGELGIPFHVFISTESVNAGDERYLDPSAVRQLSESPLCNIGSHGHSHIALDSVRHSDLVVNLQQSCDLLAAWTGTVPTTFSYPFGRFSADTTKALKESGFRYGFTSNAGIYHSPEQDLEIPRIDIWSRDSPSTVVRKATGSWNKILRFVFSVASRE
jgi:peptidoglycan/xylan/chitin deacetylase (PgdA/CDA1 family)